MTCLEIAKIEISNNPDRSNTKTNSRQVWISWARHRRTLELARALGCSLYIIKSTMPIGIRHLVLSVATVALIIRIRPKLLFVQNPSLILAMVAVIIGKLLNYRLVVDRHTTFMLDRESSFYKTIYIKASDFTLRNADLTIVTNSYLAEYVTRKGGKSHVLPDKIPDLKATAVNSYSGYFSVIFICSYAKDEPYCEVARAACRLPKNYRVYFTGDYRKARNIDSFLSLTTSSETIQLTGYLPESEYIDLLFSGDIIMDLTKLNHCIVCGSYEAIAAGKPMILTDTTANRDLFGDDVIYVKNTEQSIFHGLLTAPEAVAAQSIDIAHLRHRVESTWRLSFSGLNRKIESLVDQG